MFSLPRHRHTNDPARTIAEDMAPAPAEAEQNAKRFAEKERREGPKEDEPEPTRMDPATRRFLSDDSALDFEAWQHSRRRL